MGNKLNSLAAVAGILSLLIAILALLRDVVDYRVFSLASPDNFPKVVPSPEAVSSVTSYSCEDLNLNLQSGKLNGLSPTTSQNGVKQAFPCFTGETKEGELYNYGGGVFFLKHDFYFYTYRDFIEVRSNFHGNVSPNLLGNDRKTALNIFGNPQYSLPAFDFYQTSYGCLRLNIENGKIRQIGVHYKACNLAMKDV